MRSAFLVMFLAFNVIFCGAMADSSAYMPSGTSASDKHFIFGPHPYSNPRDVFEDYDPIMRYLEEKLPGYRFVIETSKSYGEYEEKLASKRFHFSLPNPYQTLISQSFGYHVIAKMKPDSDFRGVIVTHTDSPIKNLSDLKGRTLCFPSETAVAATLLPLLHLHEKTGIRGNIDVRINYVGSQFSSVLNAYTRESDACGTSTRFWRSWSKENPEKASSMRVLAITQPMPHNAFIALDSINPALAHKISEVLISISRDPAIDQKAFRVGQQYFEEGTNQSYRPLREFLQKYDKTIGLPQSMKTRLYPQ